MENNSNEPEEPAETNQSAPNQFSPNFVNDSTNAGDMFIYQKDPNDPGIETTSSEAMKRHHSQMSDSTDS